MQSLCRSTTSLIRTTNFYIPKSYQATAASRRVDFYSDFPVAREFPGVTINFDRYCETVEKVRRAFQNRRWGKADKEITRVRSARDRPPYSPDFTPGDYLFALKKKKKHPGGEKSGSSEVRG